MFQIISFVNAISFDFFNVGGAQHDTVAAVTHILFTITNPTTSLTSIESQLWLPDKNSLIENNDNSKNINGRFSSNINNIRNVTPSAEFSRSAGRNLLLGYSPNLLNSTANKLIKNSSDMYSVIDAHPHSSSSLTGE